MTISQRIFKTMEQKHLKQSDLANYIGVANSSVSDWKKKGSTPSADKIVKISEFLNVSVDYLLGRTNTPSSVQPLTSQDQITTEMLKAFEKLSFKDKIAVLNYTLNIENSPQIVQTKKQEVKGPEQVHYVARGGQSTKGIINISDEDLLKGETDDYDKY